MTSSTRVEGSGSTCSTRVEGKLILEEQERDLLRAFRARLFDKQMEVAHLKRKKDESAASWIARSRKLEAEVDWAREMGGRLQRVNTDLARENAELTTQSGPEPFAASATRVCRLRSATSTSPSGPALTDETWW